MEMVHAIGMASRRYFHKKTNLEIFLIVRLVSNPQSRCAGLYIYAFSLGYGVV